MNKTSVVFIILILFLSVCHPVKSQDNIKPKDFVLSLIHGQINPKKMTKKQMDTIVVCDINYEDHFPDICIYSNYGNEISIFLGQGNGLFGFYKKIPLEKKAFKIEPTLPEDYPFYLSRFYDLKITYTDGSEQTFRNKKIYSFNEQPEPRVPKWDFFNDARVFIYDFTYVSVWQSERNGQPQSTVALGDIDNDGRNEMVYTFYPVVDSGFPQYSPTRMVVFESIGHDKFIIDWDTTLQSGGGNRATNLISDFDKNGKKEFFGVAFDPNFNRGTYGLFECSGERKYRFWKIDGFDFLGDITDLAYIDTMKIIDGSNNPGMWINFYLSGVYPNLYDRISPYVYTRKHEVFGFGHFEFSTLPGAAVEYIRIPWRIDDIDIADIDRDGNNEIVLGLYGGTDFIDYMDSTGVSGNLGYQYKTIVPGVPLSGGYNFTKDFDDDGYNEIISCGVGIARGSIGVTKHTGQPGENKFTTMWWDTVGVIGQPNWGIDSATVNGKFTILHPTVKYMGPRDIEHIYTFARNGLYSFYTSSLTILDTTGFIGTKFFDIDNDDQMDIVTPVGYGFPPIKQYLGVFKMDFITQTNNNTNVNISTYKLFQNYPNPFNPNTIIKYIVSENSEMKLKVYNIIGKEIQTLVEQMQTQGSYEVKFKGGNYSSGIYFYSLFINNNLIETKRMILLK